MPEKMSAEKVAVLRALNATIIRTPTEAAYDSPESHIGVARRLQKEIPNAHILDQYGNPDNPKAHEFGTAEEIWAQTSGKVDVVVAGAGTGGTITGLARGLRKHKADVQIIAADPHGSILALPKGLNQGHANETYKVEGIGYDFVPDVLEQTVVDHWYKTGDAESFVLARRLISEEGLLVGGSSGSAMEALVQAVRKADIKSPADREPVIVVVLPDGIRNYLTKFASDDWLAANDLLPHGPPLTPVATTAKAAKSFDSATVRDLGLKPVETVQASSPCRVAVDSMRQRGFDQLPVMDGSRLVGLVTLGNVLNRVSRGYATLDDPVSKMMFNFSHLHEVTTDSRDLASRFGALELPATGNAHEQRRGKSRKFMEITMDTSLRMLNEFFEWNSAAVVTERGEKGIINPVAIACKVDLLTWLSKA